MKTIGISLGWNCSPAIAGVSNGIRLSKSNGYLTCPFDEMVSNLPGIIECISDDFKREYNNFTFFFGAGAQFIVSKETILRNTKEVYQNALDTVKESISPIEGYCLERLWPIIFLGEEFFVR